ncbi:MAG: 4-(cytidine 5'-diphospho)-2-C-methyl-D-erythritol kinase [Bacteroidales bacterium]|nr:4-(cytidine 5'-diphospho)-2-C-methyl-D-erythritol kinase [Bacteroidales bacterium]
MLTFPNAKINLGLNITERRADGYHNIETVFYPIALCDALEIVDGVAGFNLHQSGIVVDSPVEKNLVTKAYRLLAQDFELPPVDVYFHKAIPFGAGLGGGSADAAFMLKMLNEHAALALTDEQLEAYAARLGADCAFFIKNSPVYAQGIGNEFSPVELSLKGKRIVLVKPDIHVSTAEAYAGVVPQVPAVSLYETIQHTPLQEWRQVVKNDFEKSVFAQYPAIGKIKDTLYEAGAAYASMSGSGSSVYGIFENEIDQKNAFPGCFVWQGELG